MCWLRAYLLLAISALPLSQVAAAQTSSPMRFEQQKQQYFVDYGNGRGDWVQKDVLVREDGFRLMRIGGGREMQTYFRYTIGEFSFDFDALRYNDRLEPTDTWDVGLDLALKFLTQRTGKPVTMEQMREIARNIDEALRAWPPTLRDKDVPIRRVRFAMTLWPAWEPWPGILL
jgi:hypothetical protein